MFGLLGRLTPVLFLAFILGTFMAADKLWLHWYTPDTNSSSVQQGASLGSSGAVQSPSPEPSSTANPVGTTTPGPLPQSHGAFVALWVAGQRETYRVRYETSSSNGDKGDSYVIFNMPPLARVDTVPQGANEPSSQVVAKADGTTMACSPDPTGRRCSQITSFSGPLPLAAGPIVFPAVETFGSLSVTEVTARTIAGASARCFQIPSNDPAHTSIEYCFTSSGVPAYASGPFGVVEASQISGDVSRSDFDVSTP